MIIRQLSLFLLISFISQIISSFLPITFPASLFAMLFILILLILKILPINSMEKVGIFLQQNLALFFIPPAVSIMEYSSTIKSQIVPILFISIISFFLTFISTAYTVKLVIYIMERSKKNERNSK